MNSLEIKVSSKYQLIERLPSFLEKEVLPEKLERLAYDIGNCLLKVGSRPAKIYLRKLRKFFVKTNWFKRVRIIRDRLVLFRRRGKLAILLSKVDIYNLKCLARERKLAKTLGVSF